MPRTQRNCYICFKRMRSDNLKRHMKQHNKSSQGNLSIPLGMVREELKRLKGSFLTLDECLARIENHITGKYNLSILKKDRIIYSQAIDEENNIFESVASGSREISSQTMQSMDSKENCTPNKLQDHEEKQSIIISGIEIPTNKDMNILEIEYYVKNLKIGHFRRVYKIDRLPDKHKEQECGIVRLTDDPSRWVCYYKDIQNCIFFDCLGCKTPHELQKYLKTERDLETEKPVIQRNTFVIPSLLIHMSGQLCLYVLRFLLDGQTFDRIIQFLVEIIYRGI